VAARLQAMPRTAPCSVGPALSGARRLALLATLAALFALGTSLSRAELVAHGDLFVSFRGGLVPTSLPRRSLAPIAVHIDARVRTLSGRRPPALRGIMIELNRGGVLDSRGLPSCPRPRIESSSSAQALAACGAALIGTGTYLARTAFPEQSTFPAAGRILAFNSVVDGRRAILAHVYGTVPVSIARIVVFEIRHRTGTYGTVLRAELPPSVNRYGFVKQISLSLHRRYSYRGRPRSYLSAACSAPAGVPAAVFPFARASMSFADGRTLASTLTRSCRVR
jgi:hypothetical protein